MTENEISTVTEKKEAVCFRKLDSVTKTSWHAEEDFFSRLVEGREGEGNDITSQGAHDLYSGRQRTTAI